MTDTLFDIGETHEPFLQRARRRLEQADAKLADAERLHDEQGPEAYPLLLAATVEQRRAERTLRDIEAREASKAERHFVCGGIIVRGEPFWKLRPKD